MKLLRNMLIHEVIFGGYILFTLLRLVHSVGLGSEHTAIYALSLLVVAAGPLITKQSNSPWACRLRLLIYPILMNVLFVNMRWVSPLINEGKRDAVLWELDKIIAGGSLSIRMQSIVSPPLTELMSLFYIFFMPYLFLSMIAYLFSKPAQARVFYSGLFSLYGIGYMGYTLVPAIGPYIIYATEFSIPLTGYLLTETLKDWYPSGTNYTDIFPSLHCAVSAYILFSDAMWHRRRFYLFLIPCIGIWISTLYLRYHYFVDIIAGAVVAAIALSIERLEYRRELHAAER